MGILNSAGILFCCVLATFLVPQKVVGTECVIEVLEDCQSNEEDRRLDARNITVGVLESGKWGLLGTAEINLQRITLTSIEFTKCASKQEPETCMFFSTVRYKDACKMLEAKNEVWSKFFQNTEPRMKCPIEGSYSFEKSEIDLEAASKGMPGLEGYYWKIRSTLTVGKKKVGCFILEVSTMKS